MKIKINWKELGKQLWNAVKPVFLGAIGGGLVAVTGSGCSALTPSAERQDADDEPVRHWHPRHCGGHALHAGCGQQGR